MVLKLITTLHLRTPETGNTISFLAPIKVISTGKTYYCALQDYISRRYISHTFLCLEEDFRWETDFQALLAGKKEKILFLEMFIKTLNSWRFYQISFKIILLITYHILRRWRPVLLICKLMFIK